MLSGVYKVRWGCKPTNILVPLLNCGFAEGHGGSKMRGKEKDHQVRLSVALENLESLKCETHKVNGCSHKVDHGISE